MFDERCDKLLATFVGGARVSSEHLWTKRCIVRTKQSREEPWSSLRIENSSSVPITAAAPSGQKPPFIGYNLLHITLSLQEHASGCPLIINPCYVDVKFAQPRSLNAAEILLL